MFRNIKVLKVSANQFIMETDTFVCCNTTKYPMDFERSVGVIKFENGTILEFKNEELKVISGTTVATMQFPDEMRSMIAREIRRGREFDLDYRKHFRTKYSKKHYLLIADKNIFEEIKEVGFEEAFQKLEEFIEMYSGGFMDMKVLSLNMYYDDCEVPCLEFRLSMIDMAREDVHSRYRHEYVDILSGNIIDNEIHFN